MDDRDIELVRILQDGEIFLAERPFHEAALVLGWTVDEVLTRARRLKETGVIRRFAAVLEPAASAPRPSSLAVFDVLDYRAEEIGSLLSGHPLVSQCYIRPRFEGFPFNVYATVSAKTGEELEAAVGELASIAAPGECRSLRCLRELKKSQPGYYLRASGKSVP